MQSIEVVEAGSALSRRGFPTTPSLAGGHRFGPRGIGVQFGLILGAALAYFGVRGLTEGSQNVAVAHGRRVLGLEHVLQIDVETYLQSGIIDHRWLVAVANWVYIWGHWPVIAFTLVWLYRNHRRSYALLRNAMFISGAIGLVIFVAFPVAPPRLMPGQFVDTVTQQSTSYRVLQPPALVNKFAAVPSLHVGWNLLVGLILFRRLRHPAQRAIAAISPLVMAFAVVLTANHYVLDAVAGAIVATTGLWLASRLACRAASNAQLDDCPRKSGSRASEERTRHRLVPLEQAA